MIGSQKIVYAAHKHDQCFGPGFYPSHHFTDSPLDLRFIASQDYFIFVYAEVAVFFLTALFYGGNRPVPSAGRRTDKQDMDLGNQQGNSHHPSAAMRGGTVMQSRLGRILPQHPIRIGGKFGNGQFIGIKISHDAALRSPVRRYARLRYIPLISLDGNFSTTVLPSHSAS